MSALVTGAPRASTTEPRSAPVDASWAQAEVTSTINVRRTKARKASANMMILNGITPNTGRRRMSAAGTRTDSKRRRMAIPSNSRPRNRRGFQKTLAVYIPERDTKVCDAEHFENGRFFLHVGNE